MLRFLGTCCLLLATSGLLLAQAPTAELQKLDVSVGRWTFHGTSHNPRTGKDGTWTWNEDCAWSPNHTFLECTFSNVWSGRPAESLVVDTYNVPDRSFWHYEMYSSGSPGAHPFAARMDVSDNTWIEHGRDAVPGKSTGQRIVYKWDPPNRVAVTIETSTDGVHWTVVDKGEGVKQP